MPALRLGVPPGRVRREDGGVLTFRKGKAMGWLDSIFSKPDPTSEWVADAGMTADLDLDRHAVCGVALWDAAERLSVLGPPDNPRPTKFERYRYRPLGVTFDSSEGCIDAFTLVFDADAPAIETEAFRGTVRYKGEPITMTSQTREADLVAHFGEPYWRDVDDDETVLYYEWAGVEWQFELPLGDRLAVLIVSTRLTLADPEKRAALGIDKPWPPA
jgi:hypothetical protein